MRLLVTSVVLACACGGHDASPDASGGGGGGGGGDAADAPSGPPDGGALGSDHLLAFVSNRNGDYDLFLANADGTAATAITGSGGDELFPAWSPDGHTLAFASNRDGGIYAIYTMPIVGGSPGSATKLATGVTGSTTPAFSPDASRIAFSGFDDKLYVVAAAGGSATPLTDGTHRDGSPVWSADGSLLYFVSDRDQGAFDIWSITPAGSGLAQVTTGLPILGGPAISHDGKHLALSVDGDEVSVDLVSLTGSAVTPISQMSDSEPSFSADDTAVAMTSTRYADNNPEVVSVDILSGAVTRLTNSASIDGQGVFQPVP